MMRVLIVEDEVDYRESLRDLLNLEGFMSDAVGSLASCEYWLKTHRCDVIIIDRMLPDGDGLSVLRSGMLEDQVVKIVLSARGQVGDRVKGLDADADYYLVKPVNYDELRALLHRQQRKLSMSTYHQDWCLDRVCSVVHSPNGHIISLTRRETSVLGVCVSTEGTAVLRATFITALNESPDVYDPRRLEVLLRRLREKIERQSGLEFPLVSVYGVGYSFNARLRQK
jgi:two-component system OmpR family response regulator